MACADPDATAWRIVSLLDGLSLQAVAHRASIDRESVTRWGAAYAESELALPAGTLATALSAAPPTSTPDRPGPARPRPASRPGPATVPPASRPAPACLLFG